MTLKLKTKEYSGSISLHPKLVKAMGQLDACAQDSKKNQLQLYPLFASLSAQLKACDDLDPATFSRASHLVTILEASNKPGTLPHCSLLLQKMRFLIQREIISLTMLKDDSDIKVSNHDIDLTFIFDTISLFCDTAIDLEDLEAKLKCVIPTCTIKGGHLLIPQGHIPPADILKMSSVLFHRDLLFHSVLDVITLFEEINHDFLQDELASHFSSGRSLLSLKTLKDVNQYLGTSSSLEEAAGLIASSAHAMRGFEDVVADVLGRSAEALSSIPVSKLATPHLFDFFEFSRTILKLPADTSATSTSLADLDFLKTQDQTTDYFLGALPAFYEQIGGDAAVEKAFDFLNFVFKVQHIVDSKIKSGHLVYEPSSGDKLLLRTLKVIADSRALGDIYPINFGKPLCESMDEAILLPMVTTREIHGTQAAQKAEALAKQRQAAKELEALLAEFDVVEVVKPRSKASAAPKKIAHLEGAAMGGGGSLMSNKAPPQEALDVDAMVLASCGGSSAEAPRVLKKQAVALNPMDSLFLTQKFLPANLKLHPRVVSWLSSSAEGLAYYKFDAAHNPHGITEAEMILRHRLPQALLLPLFNSHYSRETVWHDGKRALKKREAELLIDGRAFTLQATLNRIGELYHFYAQPKDLSPEDEARLSEKAILALLNDIEAEDRTEMSIAGIKTLTIDPETNNLICVFEGRRYEIKFIG